LRIYTFFAWFDNPNLVTHNIFLENVLNINLVATLLF
jgi:hypothetical protein